MIRVLLFASLREAAGTGSLELPLEGPATVQSVWERTLEIHPQMQRFTPIVKAALNDRYASWDSEAEPGDEVAFFPPVSGGGNDRDH